MYTLSLPQFEVLSCCSGNHQLKVEKPKFVGIFLINCMIVSLVHIYYRHYKSQETVMRFHVHTIQSRLRISYNYKALDPMNKYKGIYFGIELVLENHLEASKYRCAINFILYM